MISVVVPAYNEGDGIHLFYQRLTAAAATWPEDYEILLVDDGSRDHTLEVCRSLAQADRRVKVLSLSRNFGQQAAVSAGLSHCSGDMVATLDADLQDPPEDLGRFFRKCREGYDVVYGIRTKRKESVFKRAAPFFYYRLLNRLSTLEIPLDVGDFCVMSRRVVDQLNRLPERHRYLRGLRTWVGFRQAGLSYERPARQFGAPKYTFAKSMRLGLDGIISLSYRPLQALTVAGLLVACGTFLLALFILCQYVFNFDLLGYNPRQARGWTSLILSILFLSGVQLAGLGLLGEYVGRLFEEAKGRPIYIVREAINFEDDRLPGRQP